MRIQPFGNGWYVAGPEVSRLIAGYEAIFDRSNRITDSRHHEEIPSTQTAFYNKVKVMTSALKRMGNPFHEESSYLLALDTKNIVDPSCADLVTRRMQLLSSSSNNLSPALMLKYDYQLFSRVLSNKTV